MELIGKIKNSSIASIDCGRPQSIFFDFSQIKKIKLQAIFFRTGLTICLFFLLPEKSNCKLFFFGNRTIETTICISSSVGSGKFTEVPFHHRLHQRLPEEYHLVYVQRIHNLLKQYPRI